MAKLGFLLSVYLSGLTTFVSLISISNLFDVNLLSLNLAVGLFLAFSKQESTDSDLSVADLLSDDFFSELFDSECDFDPHAVSTNDEMSNKLNNLFIYPPQLI